MMPFCNHQNWFQRLFNNHCWRVAHYLKHDNETMTNLAACVKHESWYRAELRKRGLE